MSFWTTFTNDLKGIGTGLGKALGAVGGNLVNPISGRTNALTQFGIEKYATPIIQAQAPGVTAAAQESMVGVLTDSSTKRVQQYDPLLQAANLAEKKVFNPAKRGLDTAFLLTDPSSPLYDNGVYGKGLQASDLQAAYDRTKDVSLGVSVTKSWLNPFHVTGIGDAILSTGNIDIDKVNLWDDKDVEKNFVQNPVGRWMSGANDAVLGNVVAYVATAGIAKGAGALGKAAGLGTSMKSYDVNSLINFEKRVDDHLSGTTQTVLGDDITRLAASKDINQIMDILKPHTNNPRMPSLIRDTQDPAIVRDFILADKGYVPALERLAQAKQSDGLWVMSDAAAEMSADYIANGTTNKLNFEQRQRVAAAFDDSIAKNPAHQEIYDAFLSDRTVRGPVSESLAAQGVKAGDIDSVPRYFGNNYQPPEPIIGSGIYAKARGRASELRAAAVTRDFSNVGGMTQRIIGTKDVPTILLKLATTKMPRGIITNSGIRPNDAIEEINAHLDDLKLFSNGSNMIKISAKESIPASEYRRRLIDDYLSARTDSERGLVTDRLNETLIYDVAATYGVTRAEIQRLVEDSMATVRNFHNDLSTTSYAMDPSGVRYVTDSLTQPQLRNATPLVNVKSFEQDIINSKKAWSKTRAAGKATTEFAYESGNKIFSFTQLVRPSYIGKNSVIEPMLVSVLSHGSRALTDDFASTIKNAVDNAKNRYIRAMQVSNVGSIKAKRALADDFEKLSTEYKQTVQLLEDHVAEYAKFDIDPTGRSPQTKIEYADTVKRDLNAAEKRLRNIEEKMYDAAPEFTADIVKSPSLYNLTRRVKYLESLGGTQYAADIANAKAAIIRASGDIETLVPNLKAIDADIASAYKQLEQNVQDFGKLHAKKADLYLITEGRSVKYGPQKDATIVMPNGQKIEGIPQYGDKKYQGDGYRSEVANTHTRNIEITGDKVFAQKVNLLDRRGPKGVTDVSSPHYFDELAYVANTYMRGDVLVDRILSGESRAELLEWGKTRQARSYAYEFGKGPEDIVNIIDNQISYINRYLPSAEAQALAARGEVSGGELARVLSPNPELLTPIQPLEVAYSINSSGAQKFSDVIDQLSAKAWTTLATPENKFRYAWASREFKSKNAQKLESLIAQGYDIDATVINGIRQSAAAEVVQELEKTFYSIRRNNRALYMARTVLAFPTASASGIYRYSRLAVQNPSRFAVFLNSYYSLYNTFGVDKYGNDVQNPLDAEFLVVPGTKEMGINKGRGLLFNARATAFTVNFAGPSYLTPVALGQVYKWKQGSDVQVKKFINSTIGKLPGYSYDELFPYGVETNALTGFQRGATPGWLPTLRKYLLKDGDGSIDWINSLTSEFKYQQFMYDAGIGPKPTDASVVNQTRKNYLVKFAWQFGSIVGSPAFVETKPMGVFQDLFNAKANSYMAMKNADGTGMYTRTEAAQLAEDYVNTTLRLPKGTPVADIVNKTAYSKTTYIPRSQEAIDRIWKDYSGLAKQLGNLDKSGELIGLITADLPKGSNPQAGRYLDDPNRTLPGGGYLNNRVKTVNELKNNLEVSRYWAKYVETKDIWDKAAKDAGYASYRSVPELVAGLKQYAADLGKESPIWNSVYKKSLNGDNAVVQAIGIQTVLNDKKFREEFGNTQFWTDAQALITYRDAYVKASADAPSGYKGKVQESWVKWLDENRNNFDPALMGIIDRYFMNDNLTSTNVEAKSFKETK